jgi:hypothetical protein
MSAVNSRGNRGKGIIAFLDLKKQHESTAKQQTTESCHHVYHHFNISDIALLWLINYFATWNRRQHCANLHAGSESFAKICVPWIFWKRGSAITPILVIRVGPVDIHDHKVSNWSEPPKTPDHPSSATFGLHSP